MDTHIQGLRGGNGKGAVPSTTIKRVKLGDVALVVKEILRTTGVTQANPALIKTYMVGTAFDGTGPVMNLIEQNLDGSGGVTVAGNADVSGTAAKYRLITADKKYLVTYTPATGSPTVGDVAAVIELVGQGILPP